MVHSVSYWHVIKERINLGAWIKACDVVSGVPGTHEAGREQAMLGNVVCFVQNGERMTFAITSMARIEGL
jgi:hypothetical protein